MSEPPSSHRPAQGAAASTETVGASFMALGAGEAVARLVAFAITLYLAQVLGADRFGSIALAGAVTLYLSRVVDAGIDLGIGVREVARAPDAVDQLIAPALGLRLVLGAITIAITTAVALAFLPSPDGATIALYSLTLIPIAVSLRWVAVGSGWSRSVGVVRGVSQVLVLAVVVLVVKRPEQLLLVPVIQLGGDLAGSLAIGFVVRRAGVRVRVGFEPDALMRLARRVAPYVASTILGLVVFNADLFFLRALRDAATVGYYAAAYTVVSYLVNLSAAHSVSLLPHLTRLDTDPPVRDALYHTSSLRALALVLPIAVGGGMLAAPLLTLLFGAEYAVGAPALRILLMSVICSALRDVPVAALMSRAQEHLMLRTVMFCAVTTLVLNIVLVPRLGMVGAAIATLATEALRLALATRYAAGLGFPVFALTRVWRPAVASLAMALVLLALPPMFPLIAVVVGAAVYGVTLTVVGGVRFTRGQLPQLEV